MRVSTRPGGDAFRSAYPFGRYGGSPLPSVALGRRWGRGHMLVAGYQVDAKRRRKRGSNHSQMFCRTFRVV
jgi:hypothetical protein